MEHAKLLFQLILETNSEHKEPNFEKWANEFRLIRERDKKTNQQIVYLLEWSPESFLLEKEYIVT